MVVVSMLCLIVTHNNSYVTQIYHENTAAGIHIHMTLSLENICKA